MSVRVMSWVFEHSKSRGNDRLVLLAIADRCDDDGGNCWKSTEKLAEKARVSKRTAQRCIDHLVALGELHSVDRIGLTSVLSVVMGGGVKLSPVSDCRGVTLVMGGASPVSPDTSLIHPTTPQPPASGGRKPTHCQRHSKFRKSCEQCEAVVTKSKARPEWCRTCDEATRQVLDPETFQPIARCAVCHPASARAAS